MPDSRERILETAFQLVREQGASAVTMAGIADAAGLSRQMVYVHFRSRAGLLTAMARDHDRRSGFAARVAAARALPPAEALERLLREWLAYVPEILPVARALEAAAITGEAGGDAWRDRMDDLHGVFRAAFERVELAPGWTVDSRDRLGVGARAAERLGHLVGERGWDAERVRRPHHALDPRASSSAPRRSVAPPDDPHRTRDRPDRGVRRRVGPRRDPRAARSRRSAAATASTPGCTRSGATAATRSTRSPAGC